MRRDGPPRWLHELFLADDSPIQSEWSGCEVLEFSNGSVVTRFRIFVRPRENADREGMRSMEEQLITYLTKKLNDDGPWKPLKINLNSIKDFVKADKTGGMAVKPSINITTPTSGTTTTITSTTTSSLAKAVITTKEIVNTSPKIVITSEGIVTMRPSTPSTTTDAFAQELVLTKRRMDVSMKSVTTAEVRTEALGVLSTATTSTVTSDYVGKFSTVTTEMHTAQPSQVASTTGRATSAVFTKGLSEVISTGLVLNTTDAATKRTTTFTTERTFTELDTTLNITPSPARSIVSTDTRTFVSTLITPIPKFDSAEKSTIKTLSEGTTKLVMARTEGTTTSFGEAVTTEGTVAFDNISTQQEITTSKLFSTTSSSSENATEIATALDLISTSTPMASASNAEPLGISTTAFTDVVYTLSTDLGHVSVNENMTTSSSKTLSFVEDRKLLPKTALSSSTALPTDSIVLNEGSALNTSAHSAVFLTTLSTEISSITDLEPNNSTINETATTSQSNGTIDSTKVPVNTPTGIVPSETPSVIDGTETPSVTAGTTVSPDVAVSTYANLNVSEAVSRETSAAVNSTHREMQFMTPALKVSTETTNISTDATSSPVEVSTNTTLSDTFSNVSDLILANASLDLSTTLERIASFVGTTISSSITATTDVDITASSVDNPTTEIQEEISKMIISTESVQVSSVAEVIITESTQQESVSQQPDNLTLGMVQKSATVPSNETSDQPEINVTLVPLSTHVLEDVTIPEPVARSTQSWGIRSTPFSVTDTVNMEVTSPGIAVKGELSPSTSKILSITTSEVTRKREITEGDRPTITSTAEYNYTSIDGPSSNISTGPIYNETIVSPLAEKEIVSNITAERTVKIMNVPHLQSTTERMATTSVFNSVKETTEIITIGINNSSIGTPQSDSSRISTDQGLVDGILSVNGNLNNQSTGRMYNETTDSPWVGKEIISNISAEITDQTVIVPQVQTTTERMTTSSVSHSARQTTQRITTEIFKLVFGSSQSSSSLISTNQGNGITSVDENFNVSSGPVHNGTTESVSNIFATYQNVTVPQIQTTTAEGMAASSVSDSARQTAQITTIETINSVFGTSQSSTDHSLFDGISSVDENFNVSSGAIYNGTADSFLSWREIVSNISAEFIDQNVTVPQVQTTTEGMTASSVSHSERQTTTTIMTETINSVFGTSQSNSSQTSTNQGLVDGISSVDENFNVSSRPAYNETTDSPLAEKESELNISPEIADQNWTVPQVQTTTERMATPSISHSARQTTENITTGTNNSTIGTSKSNLSQISTDQGIVDGISSESVIEESSLLGLTESRSQQPPTVAYVNELNATAIITVEIINFTTGPQPLVRENVSEGDPFSNNRNSNALNTSIDIVNNADITFPISSDTTPLKKGATNPVVMDVTTENPQNTETSRTILSVISDSVNITKLASESITSNDLWEMTTVTDNTVTMDNQTETVLTNAMTNTVNVTESITDTNWTANLANATENSLYNETVNVNVTETTPYILNSTNKYQKETDSGTLNFDLRDNGTSPASWNTSDNLVNTNGITLDTVTLNDTINSTDASNVTFPSLSPVEDNTLSIIANESVSNVTFVSNININSSDERTGSILTNTNVTSSPKSNTTESEPLM
ncbi:hypothetical protein CHS0354_034904 [Potamilus streckersoni]|uniref:Uncharacterized protein n=1 Tax=Potamilus streckersoni TaxID=2493646 RepID=A0AAE0SDW6_9BIVA|nr:hypothetical protein CHS0354_034904 [Potamilus streckersoni]